MVYATDGSLQLAVEVKSRPGASVEWAAQMVRNMAAHGALPEAPYFLLALPDFFYLWVNQGLSSADLLPGQESPEPAYKIDATRALSPYLDGSPVVELVGLSEQGLELLVAAWLTDLINSEISIETAPIELRPIFDSGLYDAIKKGSLATEALV